MPGRLATESVTASYGGFDEGSNISSYSKFITRRLDDSGRRSEREWIWKAKCNWKWAHRYADLLSLLRESKGYLPVINTAGLSGTKPSVTLSEYPGEYWQVKYRLNNVIVDDRIYDDRVVSSTNCSVPSIHTRSHAPTSSDLENLMLFRSLRSSISLLQTLLGNADKKFTEICKLQIASSQRKLLSIVLNLEEAICSFQFKVVGRFFNKFSWNSKNYQI